MLLKVLISNRLIGSVQTHFQPAELVDNEDKSVILDRLTPGMQVTANIIVRQRPVITLLTDVFTKGSESLQNSR